MQQSKQVRRISQDDAAAVSHTAQAVKGDLPLSSAAGSTSRDTTATAEPASNASLDNTVAAVQSSAPSQLSNPKPVPVIKVKPKAPPLMVRVKRKADDAEQDDAVPDKKQHQNGSIEAVGAGAGISGLAGLAAYGSESGSGSGSEI